MDKVLTFDFLEHHIKGRDILPPVAVLLVVIGRFRSLTKDASLLWSFLIIGAVESLSLVN